MLAIGIGIYRLQSHGRGLRSADVLLCCCAAVLLCCCAAVLLCCCAAVLLCRFSDSLMPLSAGAVPDASSLPSTLLAEARVRCLCVLVQHRKDVALISSSSHQNFEKEVDKNEDRSQSPDRGIGHFSNFCEISEEKKGNSLPKKGQNQITQKI
jgi:hypothetical protein